MYRSGDCFLLYNNTNFYQMLYNNIWDFVLTQIQRNSLSAVISDLGVF